jgi:DNA-directed RNA polymerase subunit RPC12/RpoP
MLNQIKQCNQHAVKAGLAEKLDMQILMYWMAHYFCSLIQGLKKDRPAASREDILWNILDRWGFPIVPWAVHALKASLCRLEHGLAMLLGIKPTNGKPFDPLVHIDLKGCTAAIDTWATNKTMYNYSSMDWDSLRKFISTVPLSHSYWDVDPTLGDEVWKGAWDRTNKPIAPPSPTFRMSLVPIDPWLSGTQDPIVFKCLDCPESFKTAGLLLKHCQQQHGSEGLVNSESQDLDDIAEDHWNKCKCPDCGHVFMSRVRCDGHIASGIHTDSPRFQCFECKKAFDSDSQLKYHAVRHSDERPYECHICGKTYKSVIHLNTHRRTHADNKCGKCGKTCSGEAELIVHFKEHQTKPPESHPCPECGQLFAFEERLSRHIQRVHRGEQYPCLKCGQVLLSAEGLASHTERRHGDKRKHTCPNCGQKFDRKQAFEDHMARYSDERPFECDECGATFKRSNTLFKHKKNVHAS